MKSNPERTQYWQQQVDVFEKSGLSRKAFCEQQQIKISTLEYWRRRLNKHCQRSRQENAAEWIPIKIQDSRSSGIVLRVGRIAIEINQGFDRALLVEVLQAIGTAC
jgi:hypothetical protein